MSSLAKPAVRPAARPQVQRAVPAPLVLSTSRALLQRAAADPGALNPAEVKALHHAVGSRAAQRILDSPRPLPGGGSPRLVVQTKLTVGPVGDRYEQEADRVAALAVRSMQSARSQASQGQQDRSPAGPEKAQLAGKVQHTVADDDQELQREVDIQRATGPEGGQVGAGDEATIRSERGSGSPLEPNVRTPLEHSLGADLSAMRVHADDRADQLSSALGAKAFTTGSDVFFKKGEYRPGSSEGQHLIAHEATHVVQQTGGQTRRTPDRPSIQKIARAPAANVQRQLSFDESWTSAENGLAEQERLNELFGRLESKVEGLRGSDKLDRTTYGELLQFTLVAKLKPVRWNKRTEMARTIEALILRASESPSLDEELPHLEEDQPELGSNGPITPPTSPIKGRPPTSGLGSRKFPSRPGPRGVLSPFGFMGGMSHLTPTQKLLLMGAMPSSPQSSFGPLSMPPIVSSPEEVSHPETVTGESVEEPSSEVTPSPSDEFAQKQGRWQISLPTGRDPLLTASAPGFNPLAGGKLKLEDPRLHLFGRAYEVPLEIDAGFSFKDGLQLETHLTREVKLGEEGLSATLKAFQANYAQKAVTVDGLLDVRLPFAKPFKTDLKYKTGFGLQAGAGRIDLDLPPLLGVNLNGYLEDVSYDSVDGGFGGKGHLDAVFPVLGKTAADLVLHANKLQKADFRFDREIEYPEGLPVVTGQVDGEAHLVNGEFSNGRITALLDIKLPDKDPKRPTPKPEGAPSEKKGRLKLEARLVKESDHTDFEADIHLDSEMTVNRYLEVSELDIEVRRGKMTKGTGNFALVNVHNTSRQIPIDLSEKGPKKIDQGGTMQVGDPQPVVTGEVPPQSPESVPPENEDPAVWGKWDYGYDWYRGFYLRGEINAPLFPGANGTLTGIGLFDNKQLDATVEMGNATLVPKFAPVKRPLLKIDKIVPLYRFGGLGGVFFEGKGSLDFTFDLGPIKANAHGKLLNIDLSTLKPAGGELTVGMESKLLATLEAGPHLTLGAFFLNEKLITVRGGVKAVIAAQMSSEPAVKGKKVGIDHGKLKAPEDLKLDLNLIFGVDAGAAPYGNLRALNGLIDRDFATRPLQGRLIDPRRIFDVKFSLKDFRESRSLTKFISSDLFKGGKKEDKLPPPETDIRVVTGPDPKTTQIKGEVAEAGAELPMDLDLLNVLKNELLDPTAVKVIDTLASAISTIAKGLGKAVDYVLSLLEEWGVLDRLRSAVKSADAKVLEFVESLKEAATYENLVRTALNVFGLGPLAETSEKPTTVEEVGEQPPGSEGERARTRRFEFTVAGSKALIQVEAASEPNGTVAGRIHTNALEDGGLTLSDAELTFDGQHKLTQGELKAALTLGELGSLKDFKLSIGADHRIPAKFDSAQLEASEKLRSSVKSPPERVGGTFQNTNFDIWKVEMDDQARIQLKAANPIGAGELESAEEVDFSLEKRHGQWVLVGQGFSFDGGYVTYKILEMVQDEKEGLTLKGKAIARLDRLGKAEGELLIVKNEFKYLDLKLASKLLKLPEADPWVFGTVSGGLKVDRRGPRDAALDATFQIKREGFNNGKPATLVSGHPEKGMLFFDEQWGMHFHAKLAEQSVSIIPGLADVKQFELKYTPKASPGGKSKPTSEEGSTGQGKSTQKEGFTGKGEAVLHLGKGQGQAEIFYDSPRFGLRIDGGTGPEEFRLTSFGAEYTGKDYNVKGEAAIKSVPMFDRIDAGFYYRQAKLGLNIRALKPTSHTGVSFTAGLKAIEYNLATKKFSGEGYAGLILPVLGTAKADFVVEENEVKGLGFSIEKELAIPPQKPLARGPVRGRLTYDSGNFGGAVTGKLTLDESLAPKPPTGKEPKKGEKLPESAFEFELKAGPGGIAAKLDQTGKVALYDMFELSGLDLKLDETTDVSATAAKLDSELGGKPKGLKDFNAKLNSAGIAILKKPSQFSGAAKIKASAGDNIKGELDLKYAHGEFQKSVGRIQVGTGKLDKREGPGIAASIAVSYSSDRGLSLLGGEITANLARGLQAKGSVEQSGPNIDEGLNAQVSMDGTLVDPRSFENDLIPEKNYPFVLAAFPTPVGLFTAYGNAGVKLGFRTTVGPMELKSSKAALMGIDLKERSFKKAYASLDVQGVLKAELEGAPSLGLGVSYMSPQVLALEGNLKLGLAAKAEAKPRLRAQVIYEKEPNKNKESIKPKGNRKLGAPLAFGLYATVEPDITIRAIYDMLKYKWPLGKTKPYPIMEAKTFYNYQLDLADPAPEGDEALKKMAPDSSGELQAAAPEAVKSVKLSGEKSVDGPTVNKPGESHESEDDDFAAGPMDYKPIMTQLGTSFRENVRDPIVASLDYIYRIGKKIVQLGGRALHNVVATGKEAVTGIYEWIKAAWGGDARAAYRKVQQAQSLDEVPKYKSLTEYWSELSTTTKIGIGGLALLGLGALAYAGLKAFGGNSNM